MIFFFCFCFNYYCSIWFTGFLRDRSHYLPQTVPHFVSREREYQSILRCLDPKRECRCILLHGPPGMISSQDDLVSRLLHLSSSPPEESFEHLRKIAVVPEEEKINVCLDVCFKRLSPQEQNTLVSLTLLKGWFIPSRAAKVFQSTESSERQLIDQVLELANCSLLVQNITAQGIGWYTFLSLIREYCKRKEKEQRFSRVFHSARNQCIDYLLNFLKDTFKMFLSRSALKAITDFQQEEENIMQLLEWLDNDQMDEERIMACIDVFNMVGELLAKMMSKRKFKSKYDLLKKKCEGKGDQQRLSECLTSLGIKEVFNCCCTPGLCDEASQRAKAYLEEADRIQNDLEITSGNSRAQCLAKLGRCLAQQRDPQGKPKIEEAIRIRLNHHSDEDICRVMLGATYNDMAGEFGGCGPKLSRTGWLLLMHFCLLSWSILTMIAHSKTAVQNTPNDLPAQHV